MANSAKGWTLERRQRQREAIRRWKPWAKATGPRTVEGKERVSRNAYTGGLWLMMRVLAKKSNRVYRRLKAAGFYDRIG